MLGKDDQRSLVVWKLHPRTWRSASKDVHGPSERSLCFTVYPGFAITTWKIQSKRVRAYQKARHRAFYAAGAGVVTALFCASPLVIIIWAISTIYGDGIHRTTSEQQDRSATLADVVVLLAAAFSSISWHEYGHARAAIENGIAVSSIGAIFLLGFIPVGAYIKLPSELLDTPAAHKRLSVIAAGIWHNLVLLSAAHAAVSSGVANRNSGLFSLAGYRDLRQEGVVVQSVKQISPLASLIAPSSLLVQLDDLDLHDSAQYGHWDRYLLHEDTLVGSSQDPQLGWCAPFHALEGSDPACCKDGTVARHSGQASQAEICFKQTSGITQGYCLDPAVVLSFSRCIDTCSDSGHTCIQPTPEAQLLRIAVRREDSGKQDVILYQGARRTVWSDIEVGIYRAPWWAWQGLPVLIERYWQSLVKVNISLVLFNLLPLPLLDGNEILAVLLSRPDSALPGTDEDRPQLHQAILAGLRRARLLQYMARHRTSSMKIVHATTLSALVAYSIVRVWQGGLGAL